MFNKKALLVSYPKSGSNWVRYCIEHFSGKRTPGSKRQLLVESGPAIIDRTHFLDKRHRKSFVQARQDPNRGLDFERRKVGVQRLYSDVKKELRVRNIVSNRRVILLVRSPYESFSRTRLRQLDGMDGYLSNIMIFDKCRQEKLLIYYDKLIKNFDEMKKILEFLGISYDLSEFDIEHHRQKSFELYSKAPDKPQTKNDLYDFTFHSRDLPDETKAALRSYALSFLGDRVYENYLSRFDSPEISAHPPVSRIERRV